MDNADIETLVAIRENVMGLEKISVERIWSEIKKIYSYHQNIHNITQLMNMCEVWKGVGMKNRMFSAASSSNDYKYNSPLMNAFLPIIFELDTLKEQWKLSIDEKNKYEIIIEIAKQKSVEDIIYLAYQKEENVRWYLGHDSVFDPGKVGEAARWLRNNPVLPSFPFNGDTLKTEGFAGKKLGDELKRRKLEYIKTMVNG
jgi:tRNA nucleotidyltransferase (CCA-adding enzyme)